MSDAIRERQRADRLERQIRDLADAWERVSLVAISQGGVMMLPYVDAVRRLRAIVDHEHVWTWQQNVTTKGTAMRPIEVCACGEARYADEPPARTRPPECQCLDRQPHGPHEWMSLSHRWSCNGVEPPPHPSIGDTCCGKCSGGTCYVDGVTGA